jgi:hypothetical protein
VVVFADVAVGVAVAFVDVAVGVAVVFVDVAVAVEFVDEAVGVISATETFPVAFSASTRTPYV